MNIFAVDDEHLALQMLEQELKQACPNDTIFLFQRPDDLLECALTTACDVAFLDVNMGYMSGIELAKCLKDINPNVNIIFVTGYSQYLADAMELHASGYILKPVTAVAILKELADLRHPLLPDSRKKLRAQCFGYFEIYYNDRQLRFERRQTKELFAYLINRGGSDCTADELVGILWENEPVSLKRQSYLRVLTADLKNTLAKVGADEVLIRHRGSWAVQKSMIDCDYFRMIDGDVAAVNAYHGEFMKQYSWAEFTAGSLSCP